MNALEYNIRNDPYYKDVEMDIDSLALLPKTRTDVSNML